MTPGQGSTARPVCVQPLARRWTHAGSVRRHRNPRREPRDPSRAPLSVTTSESGPSTGRARWGAGTRAALPMAIARRLCALLVARWATLDGAASGRQRLGTRARLVGWRYRGTRTDRARLVQTPARLCVTGISSVDVRYGVGPPDFAFLEVRRTPRTGGPHGCGQRERIVCLRAPLVQARGRFAQRDNNVGGRCPERAVASFRRSCVRVAPCRPLRRFDCARGACTTGPGFGTYEHVSVREGGADVEDTGEHSKRRARTRDGDDRVAGRRVADGHRRVRCDVELQRGRQRAPGVRHRSRTFHADVAGEQWRGGRPDPEGQLARWAAVPGRPPGYRLPRATGLRRGAVGEDHRSLRECGAVGSGDLRPDDPEQRLHVPHDP